MSRMYGVLRVLGPEQEPFAALQSTEEASVFPIMQERTSLGRGLHNAIVLFDPSVSRDQAVLLYANGIWQMQNVSQHTPMFIDGEQLPAGGVGTIKPGQPLQMGSTTLQLLAPDLPPSVLKLAHAMPPSAGSTLLRSSTNTWLAIRQQARGTGRWGFIGLGLLFLISLVLVLFGIGTLITQGGGTNFIGKLTLPLIPALGIVLLIVVIDRYGRRPWYLLLATFLWGALIAIPPAFFIESFFNRAIQAINSSLWNNISQSLLLGLNAGLTEETVKGIGLLVLVLLVRSKFASISDGIIYGAIIGAGFGMVENIAYFTVIHTRRDLVVLIVGRIILGWLGHSTFTACFGAAVGYMRERRARPQGWLIALGGFAIAVGLHTFFDFVAVLASDAGIGAPASAFMALVAVIIDYLPLFAAQWMLYVILMRSLARETAILRTFLAPEVCSGMVLPEEYLLLQQATLRDRLWRNLRFVRDPHLWLTLRQLQRALVGLGFARWNEALIARGLEPPLAMLSAENYRRRIRHLRREVATLSPLAADASARQPASAAPPFSDPAATMTRRP